MLRPNSRRLVAKSRMLELVAPEGAVAKREEIVIFDALNFLKLVAPEGAVAKRE